MAGRLDEMLGDLVYLDEASPFANWFKKKQAQPPADGSQPELPGTKTPPQSPPPEPKSSAKSSKEEPEKKKGSAWSWLRKAIDDPDFDPENRVKLTDEPAHRYYLRNYGYGKQPEEEIPSTMHPSQSAEEPDPSDPYEQEKHRREKQQRIRFDAVRALDRVNGLETPSDPKLIGKNATIARMKTRPGWFRAYYPGMEHGGYIIIFNPDTGQMFKRLKEKEWFERARSARGDRRPGKAKPETSQAARDEAENVRRMATATVRKYNQGASGDVKTQETDRGTRYYMDGGDVDVIVSKDGRLHKVVSKEAPQQPAGEPKKAEPASAAQAKELGDMDPGMQKAIQRKQDIDATKMSEGDLLKALERENGFPGDVLPVQLITQRSDKGVFFLPVKDGKLAPGTSRILFRSTDGKMKFLDSKNGKKAREIMDEPGEDDDDELE